MALFKKPTVDLLAHGGIEDLRQNECTSLTAKKDCLAFCPKLEKKDILHLPYENITSAERTFEHETIDIGDDVIEMDVHLLRIRCTDENGNDKEIVFQIPAMRLELTDKLIEAIKKNRSR